MFRFEGKVFDSFSRLCEDVQCIGLSPSMKEYTVLKIILLMLK